MSANGWRMGREVGLIASRMARAVGCNPCGIGIAVDVVGRRWGEPAHDWRAKHNGHDCVNVRSGLTADKETAVKIIAASLNNVRGDGENYQTAIDSRLPPEREPTAPADEGVPF